jgi:hypothetical protein
VWRVDACPLCAANAVERLKNLRSASHD